MHEAFCRMSETLLFCYYVVNNRNEHEFIIHSCHKSERHRTIEKMVGTIN